LELADASSLALFQIGHQREIQHALTRLHVAHLISAMSQTAVAISF